jgi:hypothetical protein
MKKILIGLVLLGSVSAFANYVEGNGKVNATSGFFASAKESQGVNVIIKGNAAKVLFDEISFKNTRTTLSGAPTSAEEPTGAFSGQQIRQSDFIQCVRYSKREIECRLLLNSDGTPAKLPRLDLNN